MAHLCLKAEHEQTKGNANQPPSLVVSRLFYKSMFQLVSTGDIIGRVQVIYLLVFVDIVIL